MDKKKKIIGVLITLTIIFTVMGSTFAYLSWSSSEEQKTQVTFTKEAGYSCSANGGGNITEGDVVIAPTDCTTGKHVIKREITVNPSITDINMPIYMDLWLNINSMGTGLSNSNNFKYSLTTSSTNCETYVVSSGTFTGKTGCYMLEYNCLLFVDLFLENKIIPKKIKRRFKNLSNFSKSFLFYIQIWRPRVDLNHRPLA